MKIAIIGARLAGSYAAWLLSEAGHEVWLLDPSAEREKPCGGGVTGKALERMAWLRQCALPHTEIRRMRLELQEGAGQDVPLQRPILIFARATLDAFLRERAIAAGARFVPERALAFEQLESGWGITTGGRRLEVDFLVGADGATSSVRRVTAGQFAAGDLSLALGYYIPGVHHPDAVVAAFQEPGFRGYLWSFPRVDHASIGILRLLPDSGAAELRQRVDSYIDRRYPECASERRFYAARIPCLSSATLATQRVAGRSWALLGDAAGFADAITAEGISYALRSAELLARAIERGVPESYESAWRRDFGPELVRAAAWRDLFYRGTFLGKAFLRRAVALVGRSRTAQRLTDALVAGEIGYENLRSQVARLTLRILLEASVRRYAPAVPKA